MTQHNVLKVHAYSSMLEFSLFFRLNTVFVCIDHTLFICSSVDGHLGHFHPWAILNGAGRHIGAQICLLRPCFHFFGHIFKGGIAVS